MCQFEVPSVALMNPNAMPEKQQVLSSALWVSQLADFVAIGRFVSRDGQTLAARTVRGSIFEATKHGVLTDRPGTLSNGFR